jgi:DNA replicative helicase MCM subunit Mcm2 (Cdc46/Mcm family)
MVVLSGIVISSYKVAAKATSITLQCKTCDTRKQVRTTRQARN